MKAKDQGNGVGGTTGALFGLLALTLTATVVAFLYIHKQSTIDREYISHADEMRALSLQIAGSASEASAGDEEGFVLLQGARDEFEHRYTMFANGNAAAMVPGLGEPGTEELDALWMRVQQNTDTLLDNKELILTQRKVAKALTEMAPLLQVESDEVVQILIDTGAQTQQIQKAQRQALRAGRLANSLPRIVQRIMQDGIIQDSQSSISVVEIFDRDAELFTQALNGMLNGNADLKIKKITDPEATLLLTELANLFAFVSGSMDGLIATSKSLSRIQRAAETVDIDSSKLLINTTHLSDALNGLPETRNIIQGNQYTVMVPAALTLLLLLLVAWRIARETRLRQEEIAHLQTLVEAVNRTSVSVARAAQKTQGTTSHLENASEVQAREIAQASAAVRKIVQSINHVSTNAVESAAVAKRSVEFAHKGNNIVRDTITGMDTIREQMQSTSKRIKRLGESSQEIGDTVSLIHDIADQTSILALNAAIQASSAGEAGRGFAIVADEVQRLAERASTATKQIESLVKTIQADTSKAVISMEQTTADVVKGAAFARDAGLSLEEIETVSRSFSSLISNISEAAGQQSTSAGQISNTMDVLRKISARTSADTSASARSINHLTEMVNEMRESVSGVKLSKQSVEKKTVPEVDHLES